MQQERSTVRLRKDFDVPSLLDSYQALKNIASQPAGYPGEGNIAWNSITLFSLGSDSNNLLSQTTYIQSELQKLNLRLRLARILLLEPGGVIKEHYDSFLSSRIVRLHVPIITDPEVEFYLGGERCNWKAGEFWYGDFSLPHHGENKSNITRVHLVLDATVDENLLRLFPQDAIPPKLLAPLTDNEPEFDPSVLKRFECRFTLPPGFALPGASYAELASASDGTIRLVDEQLSLFVNEQPLLKILPVSEEKLSLLGLGLEAYVDYTFAGDSVKNISLSIAGAKIPVPVTHD